MTLLSDTQNTEVLLEVGSVEQLFELFGKLDENAAVIETLMSVRLHAKQQSICIEGKAENVQLAKTVVEKLLILIDEKQPIDKRCISYAVELAREGSAELICDLSSDVVAFTHYGRQIRCKTAGQRRYIRAIKDNAMVLAIGPAGTGKTYLAVAMAVVALKNKEVSKIILTRPAVEAGEKLGFLPGDLQNKVDPYLRPLYDALYDFLGADNFKALYDRSVIEVAPLAYMRGRTLNNAFIILDEAQNTTVEQMKMFLTRFGEGSRVIVTGDVTQIDLPIQTRSGLINAAQVLLDVEGICIMHLTHKDVVRHELVQRIILAYEKDAENIKNKISDKPKQSRGDEK